MNNALSGEIPVFPGDFLAQNHAFWAPSKLSRIIPMYIASTENLPTYHRRANEKP